MPAQHFVPSFANALHLSSRAQANALKALALSAETPKDTEWGPRAAAAVILGAEWAGESCDPSDAARAAHLPEEKVAQHYARLAAELKRHAPR